MSQKRGAGIHAVRAGAAVLLATVASAEAVVLNDDDGWCWFQDERAIVVGDRLVLGSVAAGRNEASRRGAVEVTGVDLATGGYTDYDLEVVGLLPRR